MKIEWYPGHIAKAKKEIEKNLKYADLVIEVIDARCPRSTISSYVKSISKNKGHLIVVGKIDLVLENDIKDIKNYLQNYGVEYVLVDSRDNTINGFVNKKVKKILIDLYEKYQKKGIKNYTFKAIVVGMPNVGKSTFINSYVRKKMANTGDKAGITKSLQWVKINDDLNLLDTPGITVPKFDSEEVGTNLAYIGSINDDIIDKNELSYELLSYLLKHYKKELYKRYKIDEKSIVSNDINGIYCLIAKNSEA